jgi:FkbM family methyltransferase
LATLEEVIKTEVYRIVVDLVPRCGTIIDLGANIGLTSLYLTARYPACRILAVEPNPSSYSLLNVNLGELIRLGRGRILKAAVWDRSEELVPAGSSNDEHHSAFAVRAAGEVDRTEKRISGYTLQQVLDYSGFDRCDLLKVDIEGSETRLFSGNVDWLQKVGSIAIEFHGNSRDQSRFDAIMTRYRFRVYDGDPHGGCGERRLRQHLG